MLKLGSSMSIRSSFIIPAFSLSFSIFFLSISVGWGCDPNDRETLLAFSDALDIPVWSAANVSTTDCCRWVGVRCASVSSSSPHFSSSSSSSSSERIVGLELQNMMITGSVLDPLGGLGQLKFLNLSGNNLSGPIPEKLFRRAKSLEVVDLSSNLFSGSLSPAFGELLDLNFLDVSRNNLSGSIPDTFHHLKRLEYLCLRRNHFIGQLPLSLSSCTELRVLVLGFNNLSGTVDIDFTGLPKLEILDLSCNSFTGRFPKSLLSCTHLIGIALEQNTFHGTIPWGFDLLPSLQVLYLSENSFSNITGALLSLQACPSLVILQLRESFKGEKLPDKGIVGFKHLRVFDLSNCELSGVIPPWLSESTELIMLRLAGNHLTGEVPLFLTQLKNLRNHTSLVAMYRYIVQVGGRTWRHTYQLFITPSIDLSENSLSGNTWRMFANSTQISLLDLSHNAFTGSIPDGFSNMRKLEYLNLSSNQISGTIPASLNQLTFLSSFCVANNSIQGDVPDGVQFSTFPSSCFDGNPHLCYVGKPGCYSPPRLAFNPHEQGENGNKIVEMGIPVGLGVLTGHTVTFLVCMIHYFSCRYKKPLNYKRRS